MVKLVIFLLICPAKSDKGEMDMLLDDLTGREFGFLKVISRASDKISPSGQKRRMWNCQCKCGNQKIIAGQDLKSGRTKSCGCYKPDKGKVTRNKKICVICGKEFECPPSYKTVTCSPNCRKIRASQVRTGKKMSNETKEKIAKSASGRNMSNLLPIAIEAVKKSPNTGKFETNINAIDWHLISPDGEHFYFHSLNFWLRKNGKILFGCEPDSSEFKNIRSGLINAKGAMLGRNNYGCCTYKGWCVMPTEDDIKKPGD